MLDGFFDAVVRRSQVELGIKRLQVCSIVFPKLLNGVGVHLVALPMDRCGIRKYSGHAKENDVSLTSFLGRITQTVVRGVWQSEGGAAESIWKVI